MRASGRFSLWLAVATVAGLGSTLGCKDSNAVTAPVTAPTQSVNVAGTWTGTFYSDSTACASSPITATFTQNGLQVSGTMSGTSCGSSGAFKGTVSGNMLNGSIEMLGCSGGAVSATVGAAGLQLTVGDLTRPIVSGQEVVMYGGVATLSR